MPLPKNFPRPASGGKQVSKPTNSQEKKPAKRVLANRYQIEKRLGQGNFGTAWLVKDLKCKDEKEKLKVIKEISVGDLQPDETVDAMHEANLLRNLDHPNIVKFHDSFIDGDFFCLVTEYCEGGDLDKIVLDYKKKENQLPEALIVEWLIQLLLAVQYMHSRRVMHRDLKTRNIFLRNNRVKVGDFGISRILMSTSDMASTFTGTPYYMSPEVLKHEGYNSKSDVWSVGCMLYELVAQTHAFEGQSLMGVMYKIVEGNLPEWPKPYSKDLKNVFTKLLVKDPAKRPSASEALNIPFIKTQLEALKNTMMDKHAAKTNVHSINKEANEIALAMKQRPHLDHLRKESEEQKLKNMSPRERARLRKQQEADKRARLVSAATRQQYADNSKQYENIKQSQNAYLSQDPPWLREKKQQERQEHNRAKRAGYASDVHAAQQEILYDDEEVDVISDDDSPGVPRHHTMPSNQPTDWDNLPVARHQTVASDDRPITPMKNRMVYDVKNSTLDFEDGIPETEKLAETYYSQFNDEFDVDVDDDSSDDDSDEDDSSNDGEGTILSTLKPRAGKAGENNDNAANDEEMRVFITCMQNALDKNDTLGGHTLTDDTITDAYGPASRDKKIIKMRSECEAKMGAVNFRIAYDYLKKARFGDQTTNKTLDENQIMRDLKQIMKNPSDCFMVDQLLFLEEQQKIEPEKSSGS